VNDVSSFLTSGLFSTTSSITGAVSVVCSLSPAVVISTVGLCLVVVVSCLGGFVLILILCLIGLAVVSTLFSLADILVL